MAKLYFYYSAMNAGKSTMLLQSDYNYRERGMETQLFTPSFDDRYQSGQITSRIGLSRDAVVYDAHFDFLTHVKEALAHGASLSCILVDEAQFLTKDQVRQLSDICDQFDLPVLAYGIRTDFRGEPFEGSQYLLAWAEELIEVKTVCHCGRKATMNSRVDENGNVIWEGEQVHVGHDYVSTCRQHFKQGIVNAQKELSNVNLETYEE